MKGTKKEIRSERKWEREDNARPVSHYKDFGSYSEKNREPLKSLGQRWDII